jgi:hypothetical protein
MSQFWIFTFGFGHTDPVTGESRSNKFVRIKAEGYEQARERMKATFGTQWAFQYESEEEAGVEKHGLTELTEARIPGELIAILDQVYTPAGIPLWWGAQNAMLPNHARPVDVWREDPKSVLQAAEQLLGQVAT